MDDREDWPVVEYPTRLRRDGALERAVSGDRHDLIRQHVEAARHQTLAEAVQIAHTARDDAWSAVCADMGDARAWGEMDGICRVENALREVAGMPLTTEAQPTPLQQLRDALDEAESWHETISEDFREGYRAALRLAIVTVQSPS